ncbi:uncharacterized protein LOC111690338 isoform X1 [Lucilia cuprina]|uniref:uncharacterized protein LOC111690338 isoform X1 n=1 Tax=Lucilia cuprina TaxID=7375 RepID=UPI001F064B04|nr:uncharacterized protein LOC111690338 isoform X1 [Lucilia cuprina]
MTIKYKFQFEYLTPRVRELPFHICPSDLGPVGKINKMELKTLLRLTVILTVFAAATVNVDAARRVILRPLSAQEVVRILQLAGREDAVPEGRVVTQGLAAMTGFALGLTKGIGGTLLFELASSNATSQFINNFNVTGMMGDFQGINMTALTQMFHWGSANNSSGIRYKTTEICFNTRIEEPVVEEVARQAAATSPAVTSPTVSDTPATTDSATGGTGTNTVDTNNTGTGVADGTATATNTDTGTGTSIDTGTATDTKTNTVTQTNSGDGMTCIVMQKPIVRKRRSSHRKRRR